jgi:hypothetical protein
MYMQPRESHYRAHEDSVDDLGTIFSKTIYKISEEVYREFPHLSKQEKIWVIDETLFELGTMVVLRFRHALDQQNLPSVDDQIPITTRRKAMEVLQMRNDGKQVSLRSLKGQELSGGPVLAG